MGRNRHKWDEDIEEEVELIDDMDGNESDLHDSVDDEDDDVMGNNVQFRADRFFDDEAEESDRMHSGASSDADDEENEEESDHEEEELGNSSPVKEVRERPWTQKGHHVLKTCRHFSYTLIEQMLASDAFETEQVADFIALVVDELDLTPEQIVRMLVKTRSGSPIAISQLLEKNITLTVDEIIAVLTECAETDLAYIQSVGESLEVGVLTLDDPDMLESLCAVATSKNFDDLHLSRYARCLAEHTTSKLLCGRMVNLLTDHVTPFKAATVAHAVVKTIAFRDLKGTFASFLEEVKRCQEDLLVMVDSTLHRDAKTGELVDSDEDSEGNLKGFIVDDDIVIMNTSAEEDSSVNASADEDEDPFFYRRVNAAEDGEPWSQPHRKTSSKSSRKSSERSSKKSASERSSKHSSSHSSKRSSKHGEEDEDEEDGNSEEDRRKSRKLQKKETHPDRDDIKFNGSSSSRKRRRVVNIEDEDEDDLEDVKKPIKHHQRQMMDLTNTQETPERSKHQKPDHKSMKKLAKRTKVIHLDEEAEEAEEVLKQAAEKQKKLKTKHQQSSSNSNQSSDDDEEFGAKFSSNNVNHSSHGSAKKNNQTKELLSLSDAVEDDPIQDSSNEEDEEEAYDADW